MVDDDTERSGRTGFTGGTTRRNLLKASGAATGTALFGVGSVQGSGCEGRETVDLDATSVTVTEGTNVAPTPSPDGESIVMDLHGILFCLPREGGDAEPLTDVEPEPARPDYAPDGNRIAFQAYADGNFDIWTMAPDGSDLRQLTDDFWDDREPKWSPDGSRIAFSSDRGESYDIWTVDVATGELRQWTDDDAENYEPTWSPEGTEIAYVTDSAGDNADDSVDEIKAVNRDGDARTVVSAGAGETLHSPSWSPDGADIAYVRESESAEDAGEVDLMISGEQVTDGEDVFTFTPDWLSADELLYSADGAIRAVGLNSGATSDIPFTATFDLPAVEYERKSYFDDDRGARDVQGILTPRLSPDGERVAFVALNDLWMMRIGQPPRRITDDSAYQTDPAWSPDGRYVAYSSDEAGTQDLYVYDTQADAHRRVTSLDDAAVKTAWSPDGSKLAFQNQDGATLTVEVEISGEQVETGEVREVMGELFAPGRPTWSADGHTVAMAALKPYSDRFREGTSQILTVDVETGKAEYHPPGGEFESIATRANDGPLWSPDGRWMAFVVDSTLRVMPVTEDGEPDGPAKQITDEATDAPTWSGDSEWLLYLNNGQLKKVRRDGSETHEVPVRLDYRPDRPADRTVIYAGRLWDGTGPDVHEDVTIEVVNDRIRNVTPDSEPPSEPHVDASELTVIPGLWDNHVHQTNSARFFGDRQGRINLAYGVTSLLSRGDLVYRAIEGREALQSGDRVGPRFFASGELIDGSRIYYNCMRSITNAEQVPLEMSRARELDYDFVKTYVRLNATLMAEVTDVAHEELGVPVESHYLAPGALVGQDGTTHLSATQRLGYARTESATSQSYDDIIQLYGQGERSVTTTFFTSDFLRADEIEDDPRTQLFPPWERENLLADVADNAEFPSDSDCTTTACRHANTFKEILDCGGRILTGTDAPLVYYGLGVHGNLRPLVEYAFSPYEALLTATRFPAEHLGVEEDLGTVEPGKLADMVFVEGNPLEQIEDAMQVRMTMQNGELHTIEELVEPFSSESTTGDGTDAGSDGGAQEDRTRN